MRHDLKRETPVEVTGHIEEQMWRRLKKKEPSVALNNLNNLEKPWPRPNSYYWVTRDPVQKGEHCRRSAFTLRLSSWTGRLWEESWIFPNPFRFRFLEDVVLLRTFEAVLWISTSILSLSSFFFFWLDGSVHSSNLKTDVCLSKSGPVNWVHHWCRSISKMNKKMDVMSRCGVRPEREKRWKKVSETF